MVLSRGSQVGTVCRSDFFLDESHFKSDKVCPYQTFVSFGRLFFNKICSYDPLPVVFYFHKIMTLFLHNVCVHNYLSAHSLHGLAEIMICN